MSAAPDQFQAMADRVPGLVFQYRLYPDGRAAFPFASQALTEMYETTAAAVRANAAALTCRNHPEDVPGLIRARDESARSLQPFRHEYRVLLPRQGLRWRLVDARPEVLEDGSILWHGLITDITGRKEAEAEQQRLHRTLHLLSDSNTALLQAEDEGRLLPEICRLIVERGGYPLAWVGFADADGERRIHPVARWGKAGDFLDRIRISWADGPLGRGPTGTAIRTGRTHVIQDLTADAGCAPWQATTTRQGYRSAIGLPLVSRGNILGALTIYGSSTHAFSPEEVGLLEKLANNLAFGIAGLRARQQLAAANQKLQAFSYAASHDLRAPLRGINSFSTLLERQYGDRLEGDGLLYLGFIRRGATRMTALVEDLLDYSRMDQGRRERQAVDLATAVGAVLGEKEEEIRLRRARVKVDIPPAAVSADPYGLTQVLRNLLGNALKYAAPGSPPAVELGGEKAGDCWRLWVRDQGIGFDMAYREHIFEIFHRLHTYEEYPGSGVGLALVKKAMEGMGGRVWAESAPGQGATFYLELPAA